MLGWLMTHSFVNAAMQMSPARGRGCADKVAVASRAGRSADYGLCNGTGTAIPKMQRLQNVGVCLVPPAMQEHANHASNLFFVNVQTVVQNVFTFDYHSPMLGIFRNVALGCRLKVELHCHVYSCYVASISLSPAVARMFDVFILFQFNLLK